ncbi:MAG: flagellin [Rickettsiales bacterium]
MTVSTIASLAAGISTALGKSDPKLASRITSLFNSSSTNDKADPFSVTTSVQSELASLRIATRNVAQASTQIAIAQRGAGEVSDTLNQLQQLATQASDPALSDSDRAQLDNQFQQLRQQITTTVNRTSFGGQTLLDAKSSPLASAADGSGGFAGLTDRALFGKTDLNLRTASAAQAATTSLTQAQTYVSAQQAALSSVAQGVDVASATVLTALQNQDAARSSVSAEDFTTELLTGSAINPKPDLLASYSQQSLRAQSNRLPPSLVTLLGE